MRIRLIIVCLLAALATGVAASDRPVRHNPAEARLLDALGQIRNGQQQRAIGTLRDLLDARPDFKLARFLYAQMLTSLAGGTVATGQRPGAEVMLTEARRRWRHHHSPPPIGAVPSAILHLAPHHEYAIVVDLPNNRLYLFRNKRGWPRLVADFYVSIGSAGAGKRVEGDERTPVGVYRITNFIPDRQLPDLYGTGALTLNYPNAWDRHLGRTGYGIWIHGVPHATFNRAPRASEGCVVLSNSNLEWLREKVAVEATPIILTNRLHWLAPRKASARYHAVTDALLAWKQRTAGEAAPAHGRAIKLVSLPGLDSRAAMSKSVAGGAGSAPPKIRLQDVSVFAYPGEPGLIMTMRPSDAVGRASPPALFWRTSPARQQEQLLYARHKKP